MLGLAFLMFASVIVGTAQVPRPIGYLMGLSGLAYLAQGWVIGSEGFSANNTVPTLLGIVTIVAWSVWLLVSAWQTREIGPGCSRIGGLLANSLGRSGGADTYAPRSRPGTTPESRAPCRPPPHPLPAQVRFGIHGMIGTRPIFGVATLVSIIIPVCAAMSAP